MEDTNQRDDSRDVLWKDRKHFMWFPFSFTKYEVRNKPAVFSEGLIQHHL